MHAKLIALVLGVAAVASALLAVRQQRIQSAHELAQIHRKMMACDESLWRMRVAIARRLEPRRIDPAINALGETEPILLDWCAPITVAVGADAVIPALSDIERMREMARRAGLMPEGAAR
ncbi:MAG: hypothetical protein VYC34_03820 [Planctomycetota bacterium]|nr:hypothetical protein [Planctomycetota bacterium]